MFRFIVFVIFCVLSVVKSNAQLPASVNGIPSQTVTGLGTPLASANSGTIGGSSLVSFGCTTGTVTIAGATVGVNASFASPLSNPGSGLLMITSYVSAANTVTVSVCNLSLISLTPNAIVYKVFLY